MRNSTSGTVTTTEGGRALHTIEFFFDCSSPWTYLGFERIQPLAGRDDVEIVWKPILVGGVFNSVNPSVYENRENPVPAKARYYRKDLQDWARHVGVEIGQPPVFPVNSVKVMRGALVAREEGRLVPYARRAFQRYWTELADISRDDEVRRIATDAGLDADALMAKIAEPGCKDRLRANTDELIERGGFGSPTMFLDGDDMFFGNDRIALLSARVVQNTGPAEFMKRM
ncbi:MAG: 2-hydroxychromene-2-carboxylate isomerase [Pseudomonadota bacterium]